MEAEREGCGRGRRSAVADSIVFQRIEAANSLREPFGRERAEHFSRVNVDSLGALRRRTLAGPSVRGR